MTGNVDTKTRILDVAEELFADRGVERVSIRDITEAAEANLAAVNYHFGGKQELIAAVFERRIGPLNLARIEGIRSVRAAAASRSPRVEDVLEAFIRPTLACGNQGDCTGHPFARLFGRCLAEPRPEIEILLRRQFDPLVEELDAALMEALPHLSRTEIFWRMKFTFGALHHWLLTRDRFLPPWAEQTGGEEQVQKLITFASAGFRAA
jgi:AcrR family transcriptional regulator